MKNNMIYIMIIMIFSQIQVTHTRQMPTQRFCREMIGKIAGGGIVACIFCYSTYLQTKEIERLRAEGKEVEWRYIPCFGQTVFEKRK